jgi:hypothetical protein
MSAFRALSASRCRRLLSASSVVTLFGATFAPSPVFAQLDPLLFLKRVPPTVIVVLDTSFRMLDDGQGNYHDPQIYAVSGDPVASQIGIVGATSYRRVYVNLQFSADQSATSKYTATTITGIPSTAADYPAFYDGTRLEIAKKGIRQAVGENPVGPRWGLVKLRQSSPAWRGGNQCDRPVVITGWEHLNDACAGGTLGIYAPSVGLANASIETGTGTVYAPSSSTTNAGAMSTLLGRPIGDTDGLIPAGLDATDYQDRPLTHGLEDARQAAVAMMTADTGCRACRNTVVVLVTGGKDDGPASYRNSHNIASTASTFSSVSASGATRRVPIYVVAVKPAGADEAQLQQVAENSGGRYFSVSDAAGVTRAVNLAVQAGYARASDFDRSEASEFLPVTPIVGTVPLYGAETATGASIPASETVIVTPQGTPIPQRSNVMVTAGFALGGDAASGPDGRIRAFRAFKPVPDATRPAGYRFVKDGTPLWPDRDGRPHLANLARVPANPGDRNIYTFVPGSGVIRVTASQAAALQPHLGVPSGDVNDLIDFVRSQPIGAVIGSTPALMDPPSLDPAPDHDYGHAESDGTYAGRLKDRRSLIFFGANDGMIHAVDARTGYEVWAFVPFNLLPKLRTLRDGQPIDQFDYFVDSSPKIAEVKMNGDWRSLLIIGQSMGGTFYQTFDVTEAGMGGPPPESDDYQAVLSTFQDPSRIAFLWAFPGYDSFDTTYTGTFTVTDGWPGGRVKFYGELKVGATAVEKSVGFTWSDPAVGPLTSDRSVNVAVVGSGYFPAVTLPGRTGDQAGRSLYLLDLTTGRPLGSPSSCGTGTTAQGCVDVGEVSNNGRKNAVQADPTAAGVANGTYITKAYAGDIDGRYWRFDFTGGGSITRTSLLSAQQSSHPIYSSSALMLVGSLSQYVFFSTGSDLLPLTTAGGMGPFTMYGLLDQGSSAVVKVNAPLDVTSSKGSVVAIERPSTSPSVAGDIVFFTATTERLDSLCQDFSSRLYAFTYQGGAAYDTDNSGSISKNESPVVRTTKGRATAPFVVDQHLYFATSASDGANIEAFGDPEDYNNGVGQVGVRILSWREIR